MTILILMLGLPAVTLVARVIYDEVVVPRRRKLGS
jgi:hypothetical protein